MSKRKQRRTYDASGRQARALANQERILDVARRLFAERGYAETTIEMIAKDAAVAAPTIYAAFQSKRGLLDRLIHRLVSGEPGAPPLLATAGAQHVAAAVDPRELFARFVRHLVGVQTRAIPIYEVMKSAARTEPEIATLVARMQDYRLANVQTIADRVAELGLLREGLSRDDAGRTVWLLTSPEVRQVMLGQAAWTEEHYIAWLEDQLAASLLRPR